MCYMWGKRRHEGGFVLILTLLVTAILVAVAVEFSFRVYISTSRAANFRDSQRAGVLAGDGMELAVSAMKEVLRVKPYLVMGRDGLTFTKKEGDMDMDIRVFDELSKVSTRLVYSDTGVENNITFPVYSRLLERLGFDEGLVAALADWIDSDDVPRTGGAEAADTYQRLPAPYVPANTYLKSLEELGMIDGYTQNVVSALAPFVSPYNTSGLININTAAKEVILSLADDITPELADSLIKYRKENPFKDKSEIMKVAGFETIGFELQDKIVVQSDIFRVYSKVVAGEVVREVEAVVKTGGDVLYWREF